MNYHPVMRHRRRVHPGTSALSSASTAVRNTIKKEVCTMSSRSLLYVFVLLALFFAAVPSAWAYDQAGRFTRSDLDELLGPIALYPDPLLAQVLPASTFVDDIQEAAEFVAHGWGDSRIDRQYWDISVKSVAHYPPVLNMMAERLDWTIALGQAYIEQPEDVMDAIQRLRAKARSLGYLSSSDLQEVIFEPGYISIEPRNPRYIYVPRYDPRVVYTVRARSNDFSQNIFSFGLGLLIGSWLNRDVDWDHHCVYYHGWQGNGWISRSRPHIRVDSVYLNTRYEREPVRVDRSVQRKSVV